MHANQVTTWTGKVCCLCVEVHVHYKPESHVWQSGATGRRTKTQRQSVRFHKESERKGNWTQNRYVTVK